MNIELPFFVQENRNTCTLACLRMVLAAFGTDVSEAQLKDAARMEPGGTDISELERLARQFGLQAEIQEPAIADFEPLMVGRKIAISYIDRFIFDLTPAERPSHSVRDAKIHTVIPTRVSESSVWCHDPLWPRPRRRSRRLFERAYQELGSRSVVCGK